VLENNYGVLTNVGFPSEQIILTSHFDHISVALYVLRPIRGCP